MFKIPDMPLSDIMKRFAVLIAFKIPDMQLSDIMKRFAVLIALFLSCAAASAQDGEREQIDTVMLWPDGAPNAFTIPEPGSGFIVFKAHDYEDAMMEVYPAQNPNGLCVIMCPGGAPRHTKAAT